VKLQTHVALKLKCTLCGQEELSCGRISDTLMPSIV
jgi:hypothetical protein